ncbi:MAG: DUF4369 domain-containing protein [Bacteroidales bacterium]|nr:DUF4369 domain-containing protein [Bacteroidales bacterium]
MKRLFAIISLAAVLFGCSSDKSYVIEGTLYGAASFEGETIYMVPFGSSSTEGQDSAVISNGRFVFEGTAERPEVCELRVRPMMRLFLDRDKFVIIKEPGHLWVALSKQSTARGTALNDSLQVWREYKYKADSVFSAISKQMKVAKLKGDDSSEIEALEMKYETFKNTFIKHNKEVAERNDNVFGDYIEHYAR